MSEQWLKVGDRRAGPYLRDRRYQINDLEAGGLREARSEEEWLLVSGAIYPIHRITNFRPASAD